MARAHFWCQGVAPAPGGHALLAVLALAATGALLKNYPGKAG